METREAVVGGLPMRWLEHGTGPAVILIHGIPTGPALWRHVLPRIGRARCLAWEMVGYGASMAAGSARDISVARQVEHLADWLDHLEIREASLAGHDLGGGVAQILAVREPERCSGLLLTNSIGYDSWPMPSVKAMQAGGALVRRLPRLVFAAIFATFLRRGHARREAAAEAIDTHWPTYAAHGTAAAFPRHVAALKVEGTLAVAPELPTLNVPARIVWGVADPFQKIAYGERFARDLRAPLRRIEAARHFVPEDHPAVLAEEIALLVRPRTTSAPHESLAGV